MENEIKKLVDGVLKDLLGLENVSYTIEHPADVTNGDYSTNIAFILLEQIAAQTGSHVGDDYWARFALKSGKPTSPREVAEALAELLRSEISKNESPHIEKIDVAGPGFINFYLAPTYFKEIIKSADENFGRGDAYKGQLVMCEYTDPNPFKEFHIGHLVPNAIGEAISRLIEFQGATMKRTVYQGDVGMHVAASVWGMMQLEGEMPSDDAPLADKVAFLGRCYVHGTQQAKDNEEIKKEIVSINKKIFERSDKELNDIYDKGRKWSMNKFEEIYEILGTKFDYYMPESSVWERGRDEVLEHPDVFPESDGAKIYKGENRGLHTRVFVNKEGLPTYEAKDIGLMLAKFEAEPNMDLSITVTGNEQKEYFKVVREALLDLYPEMAKKVLVITNGMLKIPSGKMSSSKGNVITGAAMIEEMQEMSREKMKEREGLSEELKEEVSSQVAVAAIKYGVLKQAIGKDFVFDPGSALSFEGDSGPYLQYSYARGMSVIEKAKDKGISAKLGEISEGEIDVARMVSRFPEVAKTAATEFAPHQMITYLTELAASFNSYYANNPIVDEGNKELSGTRVALTTAVTNVLCSGMWTLGIVAPGKM